MIPRPHFTRRFLLGYDPAEVEPALDAYEVELERLQREVAEQEARCHQLLGMPAEGTPGADTVALPRTLLGYRRRSVQALVAELTKDLERAVSERNEARDRASSMQEELTRWRSRQEQIDALALRASDDAVRIERRAVEHADHLLEEAQRKASVIVDDARRESRRLLADTAPEAQRRAAQLTRLAQLQRELSDGIRHAMSTFDQSLEHVGSQLSHPAVELLATAQDIASDRPVPEPEAERGPEREREPAPDVAEPLLERMSIAHDVLPPLEHPADEPAPGRPAQHGLRPAEVRPSDPPEPSEEPPAARLRPLEPVGAPEPEEPATVHSIVEHAEARGVVMPARSVRAQHRVKVGPLQDYAELAGFVRRLSALDCIEDVFVETFDHDTAELSVQLAPGAWIEQAMEQLDGAQLVGGGSPTMPTVRLAADH